jgi:hypothetical protein
VTPAEDGVIRHVQRFFEGQDVSVAFQSGGPVLKRVPNFRVLEVAAGPRLPGLWTYVSLGFWDAGHNENGHGLECLTAAPQQDDRHILHLAMTAYYHAEPSEQRLDLGHTVPIGEGWTLAALAAMESSTAELPPLDSLRGQWDGLSLAQQGGDPSSRGTTWRSARRPLARPIRSDGSVTD